MSTMLAGLLSDKPKTRGCLPRVTDALKKRVEPSYQIDRFELKQPLKHSDASCGEIKLRCQVLSPSKADVQSPVFVFSSGERRLTKTTLVELIYRKYEKPPWHFAVIEHRGYGPGEPKRAELPYICVAEAVADMGAFVDLLRKRFTGPFIAAGWSYPGILALLLAYQRPDCIKVVMLSSTPVRWPFLADTCDEQLKKVWPQGMYERAARHVHNLTPTKIGDATWVQREFFQTLVFGTALFPMYSKYLPLVNFALKHLPTPSLIVALRAVDKVVSGGQAYNWASTRAATEPEDSLAKAPFGMDGFTFGWQQAAELGVFFSSQPQPDGLPLWPQGEQHYRDFCRRLQQTGPTRELNLTDKVHELQQHVVIVRGFRDPWLNLCLQRRAMPNKTFVDYPFGQHDPDVHSSAGAKPVRQALEDALQKVLYTPL